jgi:hypothetical protein
LQPVLGCDTHKKGCHNLRPGFLVGAFFMSLAKYY